MREPAQGAQLQVGDGADPEEFTTIAQVIAFTPPGIDTDMVTLSDHDMEQFRVAKLSKLSNPLVIPFRCHYDPNHATHDNVDGLMYLARTKEVRNFKIVFPDTESTEWDLMACQVRRFRPTELGSDGSEYMQAEGEIVVGDPDNSTLGPEA